MPVIPKLLKIAGVLLLYLVATDVAGAIVSLIFEILIDGGPAFYILWFIFGLFCGLLGYGTAGQAVSPGEGSGWTSSPGALGTGRMVCAVCVFLLAGLSTLFFWLLWSDTFAADNYVPDSMPLTFTFFAAVLLGAFGSHSALVPSAKPSRP